MQCLDQKTKVNEIEKKFKTAKTVQLRLVKKSTEIINSANEELAQIENRIVELESDYQSKKSKNNDIMIRILLKIENMNPVIERLQYNGKLLCIIGNDAKEKLETKIVFYQELVERFMQKLENAKIHL